MSDVRAIAEAIQAGLGQRTLRPASMPGTSTTPESPVFGTSEVPNFTTGAERGN